MRGAHPDAPNAYVPTVPATPSTAVLIDLDDTLYLESSFVGSGYRAVATWAAERLGLDASAVPGKLWRHFSRNRSSVLSAWLDEHGRPDQLCEAIEIYRGHRPLIELVPGWTEALETLRHRGHRLGLVSDGRAPVQRRKVEALQLTQLLDDIVISDELGGIATWKPSPVPYLVACERLGVAPSRAIYVGDNPAKDFLGACRAGLASVRLRWPGGLHHDVEPAGPEFRPDYETTDLEGVMAAVDRWAESLD